MQTLTDCQIRVLARRLYAGVSITTKVQHFDGDMSDVIVPTKPFTFRALDGRWDHTFGDTKMVHLRKYAFTSRGTMQPGWLARMAYLSSRDEILVSDAQRLDIGWVNGRDIQRIKEMMQALERWKKQNKFGSPVWRFLKAMAMLD